MYFSLFRDYFPFEKGGSLFEQTLILFTKKCFVSILVEIGSVVLEKKKMVIVYDNDRQRTNCGQIKSLQVQVNYKVHTELQSLKIV